MTRLALFVSLSFVLIVSASDVALARGGAANIMDSPGYQRRLQESRGLVSVQSAQPTPQPVYRVHRSRHRQRH